MLKRIKIAKMSQRTKEEIGETVEAYEKITICYLSNIEKSL